MGWRALPRCADSLSIIWITEDMFPQSCSSVLAKIIEFVNRKRLMRYTRQLWTILGRIERDFGEWIDVAEEKVLDALDS